jgi:integrase
MKGTKRFRSGAWRLKVFAGWDPVTNKRIDLYETVKAPNNRAGAKLADARLAEMVTSVESGQPTPERPRAGGGGMTVRELAERWEATNRPRQNERTGEWIGWSPKTAKTHSDNFRLYILPDLGNRQAQKVTGLMLDDLYLELERERGLSPAVVVRCHSQIRAMFNWAIRKKLVTSNPADAADPPKTKTGALKVPEMSDVRKVMELAPASFSAYAQLAATVGARRGTLLALRWANVDFENNRITFDRALAESSDGVIEKGTKADRPYVVSLGSATAAMLKDHRKRSIEAALHAGHDFGPRSFVFSDDGGQSHWNPSWPTHAWKHYAEKVGLTNVRLHDLRHTAASQMLMAGIPISIVAERLGCTEANILRTYRHFIPGSDGDAAELMDSLLNAEAPATA